MINIQLNQEVFANKEYITCESGAFNEYDFVKCKHKFDTQENTCAFHAISIVEPETTEVSE